MPKFFVYLLNAFYWPIFLCCPVRSRCPLLAPFGGCLLLLHQMARRAACFMLLLVSYATVNGPPYRKLHAHKNTDTLIYIYVDTHTHKHVAQHRAPSCNLHLPLTLASFATQFTRLPAAAYPFCRCTPFHASASIRCNWHFEFIYCYYFFNKRNLLTVSRHSRAKVCWFLFLILVVVVIFPFFFGALHFACAECFLWRRLNIFMIYLFVYCSAAMCFWNSL